MKLCFALPDGANLARELAPSLPCRLLLDFDGAAVEAAASAPALIDRLRRVYRHFLVGARAPRSRHLLLLEPGSAAAAILARRLGRAPLDGHVLIADWLPWGLLIDGAALLHYYASKLLRLWVVEQWHETAATIHAAALGAPEGGGLLMVGEAAAGKTTLALRLIERGFRFASDDTSCIRRRDLACLPFPMAFVLRADRETGRPATVALDGVAPHIALLDEPRWLHERWDAAAEAPFHPTALYFLDREAGIGAAEAETLPAAEAALLLVRNLVMPLGADAEAFSAAPENFDFACRLAAGLRCARLDTSDLDGALQALLADWRSLARPLLEVAR
ncbi:MAG TPA: hypothetical protein VEI03_08425 [Stellaceae bacterium]|nr:hypothetical protein [Stellaceae bacterium]